MTEERLFVLMDDMTAMEVLEIRELPVRGERYSGVVWVRPEYQSDPVQLWVHLPDWEPTPVSWTLLTMTELAALRVVGCVTKVHYL